MPNIVDKPRSILERSSDISVDIHTHAREDADSPNAEVRGPPSAGRYVKQTFETGVRGSEAAVIQTRLKVAAEWFHKLVRDVLPPELFKGVEDLTSRVATELRKIADTLPLEMVTEIKTLEDEIRHDVIAATTITRNRVKKAMLDVLSPDFQVVTAIPALVEMAFKPMSENCLPGESITYLKAKAVEYLRATVSAAQERVDVSKFDDTKVGKDVNRILSYFQIALTSEDSTSPAHALTLLNQLNKTIVPKAKQLLTTLRKQAATMNDVEDPKNKGYSLGARYRQYTQRLEKLLQSIATPDFLTVKFGGATGTSAALGLVTKEGADTQQITSSFVAEIAPELHHLPVTAQINPHDDFSLWNQKLGDFCQEVLRITSDVWEDSGRDVEMNKKTLDRFMFVEPETKGASGSSAMPQKIQTINMERAEGTAFRLKATARGMEEDIDKNRLQRALRDSVMIRNMLGDDVGKLGEIMGAMTKDIPRLTVNKALRRKKKLKQELPLKNSKETSSAKVDFSAMRKALASKAMEYASLPMLAKTHNQPASPTTVGHIFLQFEQRLAYLEGVAHGNFRGRDIRQDFSAEKIQQIAVSVIEQFLGDLHIYTKQRNGLMKLGSKAFDIGDQEKLRSVAVEFLKASPKEQQQFIESITVNANMADKELNSHYECLGEAVQTILRINGVDDAYELTKKVVRGAKMNKKEYQAMIRDLMALQEVKDKMEYSRHKAVTKQLLDLTPQVYTGDAERIVRTYAPEVLAA